MKQFFFLLILTSGLLAHGVSYEHASKGAGLKVVYADGSPMAWVDVTVYSPADPDDPFQSGLSDANGCFVFVPDTSGTWTMVFDDGLGHGLRQSLEISKDLLPEAGVSTHTPLYLKLISGLALIFGITSLLYIRTLKGKTS